MHTLHFFRDNMQEWLISKNDPIGFGQGTWQVCRTWLWCVERISDCHTGNKHGPHRVRWCFAFHSIWGGILSALAGLGCEVGSPSEKAIPSHPIVETFCGNGSRKFKISSSMQQKPLIASEVDSEIPGKLSQGFAHWRTDAFREDSMQLMFVLNGSHTSLVPSPQMKIVDLVSFCDNKIWASMKAAAMASIIAGKWSDQQVCYFWLHILISHCMQLHKDGRPLWGEHPSGCRRLLQKTRIERWCLQTILEKLRLQRIFGGHLPMAWKVDEAANLSLLFGAHVLLGELVEVDFVGSTIYDNLETLMAFSKFGHEFFVRTVLCSRENKIKAT